MANPPRVPDTVYMNGIILPASSPAAQTDVKLAADLLSELLNVVLDVRFRYPELDINIPNLNMEMIQEVLLGDWNLLYHKYIYKNINISKKHYFIQYVYRSMIHHECRLCGIGFQQIAKWLKATVKMLHYLSNGKLMNDLVHKDINPKSYIFCHVFLCCAETAMYNDLKCTKRQRLIIWSRSLDYNKHFSLLFSIYSLVYIHITYTNILYQYIIYIYHIYMYLNDRSIR